MNSNISGHDDFKHNNTLDHLNNYNDRLEYEYQLGINYFKNTQTNNEFEFSDELNVLKEKHRNQN